MRVWGALKMPQYKIRYKDGRSHVVEADKYQYRTGVNQYEFTRSNKHVLTISGDRVESVGLADIPDPEAPEVEVSELRR